MQGKGNETPLREPEAADNPEVQNNSNQVSEELNRVTRYRDPDPTLDDPDSSDAVKPYTSVRCHKEAKEVIWILYNNNKFTSQLHINF